MRTFARAIAATVLVGVWASAACATHEPVPAFRSAVVLDDRGISVPLPPPSLLDNPTQDVDVDGEIEGDDIVAGTSLRVFDMQSGEEVEVELDAGQATFSVGMTVDLSENCLEFWLEGPDGGQSDRALFSAHIVSDTEVETRPGC